MVNYDHRMGMAGGRRGSKTSTSLQRRTAILAIELGSSIAAILPEILIFRPVAMNLKGRRRALSARLRTG